MRLDDVCDPHAAQRGRGDHPGDVAGRVDGHGRPLAAGEMAGVAEPRRLDGVDEEHGVLPSSE
ncbi:hypothetical protein [Streptomyces sp. NPDC001410]|uniref:hypothetical protein n=1 Tax=Streptomyces sp. NPDC001410 TaxID=3364574 RepID=UPI00367776B9